MNNELYHYGVVGMKWGIRRAKKQLSKYTGRNKSEISDDEALNFKKDVNAMSDLSISARKKYGKNLVNSKYGQDYTNAVMKKAGRERVGKIIGATALVAGGSLYVKHLLNERTNKVAAILNKNFDKTIDETVSGTMDIVKKDMSRFTNTHGKRVKLKDYMDYLDKALR